MLQEPLKVMAGLLTGGFADLLARLVNHEIVHLVRLTYPKSFVACGSLPSPVRGTD